MFGQKITAGVVYHGVNFEQSYSTCNDTMVVEYIPGVNHIAHGIIAFDYVRFHEFLQILVDDCLF